MLADDGAKLRPLLASLTDLTAERIMTKICNGYETILVPNWQTDPATSTDTPGQE
ncbi:hypothetical protein [Natronoglycomyces albus]|uniref:Uncharacterized protein n=1 Tax=Natronoglycomyces albus TaxID=2811108 RepID=A0A895XNF2_9ACTN|nr:hypothetical protein [Natronoglycomyces albus]QSB07171.1 hypothetical protein JQS30_17160 [Natronoglycomyces albus]